MTCHIRITPTLPFYAYHSYFRNSVEKPMTSNMFLGVMVASVSLHVKFMSLYEAEFRRNTMMDVRNDLIWAMDATVLAHTFNTGRELWYPDEQMAEEQTIMSMRDARLTWCTSYMTLGARICAPLLAITPWQMWRIQSWYQICRGLERKKKDFPCD